jgi:multidrug efflux system membrane fusion protein
VDVFDADDVTKIASGVLTAIDNEVDPTTGTVRLKAEFANADGALFPNQFVNARLLVETLSGAIAVPTSAIQRGAPGTYVYVIKDDSTVTVRPVKTGVVDGEMTAITEGLAAGERVVADGADKLREGARVEAIDRSAGATRGEGAPANGATGTVGSGERKKGRRQGTEPGATVQPATPDERARDARK